MHYPDARTMKAIAALTKTRVLALELYDDGVMILATDRGHHEILGHEVDDLLGRGWVEERDDGLEVTPAGRYWYGRWQRGYATRRAA